MEILIKYAGSGFELNIQSFERLNQHCFKRQIANIQNGFDYFQNVRKVQLVNNNDGTYYFKKNKAYFLVKFQ